MHPDAELRGGLREAHTALLHDLAEMKDAVFAAAEEDRAEIKARLDQTRTHIAEHFRFEEDNGYMDVVLQREPHQARTIEGLRDEHRRLAEQLEAIVEHVAAGRRLDKAFREAVLAWLKAVRHHEAHESRLVQDAFNIDFGWED
jgi:hemerythrin-like domain-containing protein